MLRKVNAIHLLLIVGLGIMALFFLQDYLNPNPAAASDQGSGYYGDVSYTCGACPDPPRDCWQQGDRVEVFTYPMQNPTGVYKNITKTGAASGFYSNLVPPDVGYWYLRGLGTYCRSDYYLVYWTGELMETVEQDINMYRDTPIEGPEE
jgi:hypothetical protein